MIEYLNPHGVYTYQNILQLDGQIIHALNVYSPGEGFIAKRAGYGTLGSNLGARVQNLFSYSQQNDTTIYTYAAAGSLLYYSYQGTQDWLVAGNGTIADGNNVGHAVLNNTLIIGDGAGSTRHTANGSVFTNTTLAPVAQYLQQYHNRIYVTDGTSSVVTYSSYGSADNWSISLPADSSSFVAPGECATKNMFVAGDRLQITKGRENILNWDDSSLVDSQTKYGPISPWSLANIDEEYYYLNQMGIFKHDGANRTLISNAVQNQFYNRQNTGITVDALGSAPATCHIWDYLVAVGTITDPVVGRAIPNAIIKYDSLRNLFHNWSFAHPPTSFMSYLDYQNQWQLAFGDTTGQVYQMDQTTTSDNGSPIQTDVVMVFTYASQAQVATGTTISAVSGSTYEKLWRWIRLFFNPGDEVNIQFAFSNTLTYQHLRWSEAINTNRRAGDYHQVSDGVVEIRFPNDPINSPRSRFLFVRIYDNSDSSQWVYQGCQIDAEPVMIT